MIPTKILDYFIKIILCGLQYENVFRKVGEKLPLLYHLGKCKGRNSVNDLQCTIPLISKCEHVGLVFTHTDCIEYVYFNGISLSCSVFESIGFNSCVIDLLRRLMNVKIQFAEEFGLQAHTWENEIIQNSNRMPLGRCLAFIVHDSMYDCCVCLRRRTESEKKDFYKPCTCAEINAPNVNGIFDNSILYVLPYVIFLDCIFYGIWYSIHDCFKICFHNSRYFYLMILINIKGIRSNIAIKARYKCLDTKRYRKRFYKSYTVKDSDKYMYFLRQCQPHIFDPSKTYKSALFASALTQKLTYTNLSKNRLSADIIAAFNKYNEELFILYNLPYTYTLVRKYIHNV